jgi:tetratricopeptide (TPR) repeat protein
MNAEHSITTPATSRIGQRIRRARLARNLTQGELANGIFSVSYVSAVERGQIRPSLGALQQLADRLQVPPAELLSSEFDPELDAAVADEDGWTAEADHAREEITSRLREAQVLSRQGRSAESIAVLRDILARASAPRDLALAHSFLAAVYNADGRPDAARTELLEAIPIAERIGDRELLERCRNDLGNAYFQLNQPLLALECHRACYHAVQRGIMRDSTFKLSVMTNLGNDYLTLGEFDQAIEVLQEAAALSTSALTPDRLAEIYRMLSASYGAQGDTARAKRYALHSIQSYEEAGNKRQASYVHTQLGRTYLASNMLEDAEAHLRVAYDIARKLGDPVRLAEAACSLSALYLQRNQADEAEAQAREALAVAESQPDPLPRTQALIALSAAMQARGKQREADKHLRSAVHYLDAVASPRERAAAAAQVSALYERRGDIPHAIEYLRLAWRQVGRSKR